MRDHLHATQWVLLNGGTYLKLQLNTLVSPVSLCRDRKNKEFSRSFLWAGKKYCISISHWSWLALLLLIANIGDLALIVNNEQLVL